MAWKTVLETEQIGVRIDDISRNIILEVNGGGVMNNYVTLHLNEAEAAELIQALELAKNSVGEKK